MVKNAGVPRSCDRKEAALKPAKTRFKGLNRILDMVTSFALIPSFPFVVYAQSGPYGCSYDTEAIPCTGQYPPTCTENSYYCVGLDTPNCDGCTTDSQPSGACAGCEDDSADDNTANCGGAVTCCTYTGESYCNCECDITYWWDQFCYLDCGGGGGDCVGVGHSCDDSISCCTGSCVNGTFTSEQVAPRRDPEQADPSLVSTPTVLIIDLPGRGYRLTGPEHGVTFDLRGDHHPAAMSWTSASWNGSFLALDLNGNGRIDGGTEMYRGLTNDSALGVNPPSFNELGWNDPR
jgi:hypothetical protein